MAKAIERRWALALDMEGGDWEVANYGGVNPFYTGVPRDYLAHPIAMAWFIMTARSTSPSSRHPPTIRPKNRAARTDSGAD